MKNTWFEAIVFEAENDIIEIILEPLKNKLKNKKNIDGIFKETKNQKKDLNKIKNKIKDYEILDLDEAIIYFNYILKNKINNSNGNKEDYIEKYKQTIHKAITEKLLNIEIIKNIKLSHLYESLLNYFEGYNKNYQKVKNEISEIHEILKESNIKEYTEFINKYHIISEIMSNQKYSPKTISAAIIYNMIKLDPKYRTKMNTYLPYDVAKKEIINSIRIKIYQIIKDIETKAANEIEKLAKDMNIENLDNLFDELKAELQETPFDLNSKKPISPISYIYYLIFEKIPEIKGVNLIKPSPNIELQRSNTENLNITDLYVKIVKNTPDFIFNGIAEFCFNENTRKEIKEKVKHIYIKLKKENGVIKENEKLKKSNIYECAEDIIKATNTRELIKIIVNNLNRTFSVGGKDPVEGKFSKTLYTKELADRIFLTKIAIWYYRENIDEISLLNILKKYPNISNKEKEIAQEAKIKKFKNKQKINFIDKIIKELERIEEFNQTTFSSLINNYLENKKGCDFNYYLKPTMKNINKINDIDYKIITLLYADIRGFKKLYTSLEKYFNNILQGTKTIQNFSRIKNLIEGVIEETEK